MNSEKSNIMIKLTQYILHKASELDSHIKLTKISLIKFHYLADMIHARENNGKTLSGWKWEFHKYGPWALESLKTIEKAQKQNLVSCNQYESNYDKEDYSLFFLGEEIDFNEDDEGIPICVTASLDKLINKWAGCNTNEFLHYIYFETEPMMRAKPGDDLNFSDLSKKIGYKKSNATKLSKKQIEKGKEIVKKIGLSFKKTKTAKDRKNLHDDVYYESMKIFDEDESDISNSFSIEASVRDILSSKED